jgi:hypothetical protein
MNYIVHDTSDDAIGSIEHQLYPVPFVNAGFAYEDSGGGKLATLSVDTDAFRKKLWNATMNGQYPTFGNTGTVGGEHPVNAKFADSAGAKQMTAWTTFFADTRHWELEPYFDVDGGRALALEGVEYILYVEKPGPVELALEKHTYEIHWVNPITGEVTELKKFKAERWAGEPPDKSHDWVLHIEREGRKESMLRSYKFDSRQIPLQLQEPEQNPQKVPVEMSSPSGNDLSMKVPPMYSIKVKRDTRATRSMMYLWTGEVVADNQGARVLGTGREGTLNIPREIIKAFPAVLSLRVAAMNANGKIYLIDKVFKVTP